MWVLAILVLVLQADTINCWIIGWGRCCRPVCVTLENSRDNRVVALANSISYRAASNLVRFVGRTYKTI